MQNIKTKLLTNFILSLKGWRIYHKLVHKYPLDHGLYILIPKKNDRICFCAALYLNELLQQRNATSAIFLTSDPNIEKHTRIYTNNVKMCLYFKEHEIKELLQFYRLYNFSDNFIVASFSEPFGKNCEKLLDLYPDKFEELFALCIYRIKPYNQLVVQDLMEESNT